MNNLVCSVICLIVGILIYIVISPLFSVCKKKEGMAASMGKVHLEKCCPFQYKWDKNKKKCVKICDGCDLETYGKIRYEILKQKIKSGPVEDVMEYYTCDDNDSSNVYNYKELSGIFNHGQVTDQYNFTGDVVESDMDAVAASEERGNESWADVRVDAPKRMGRDEAQIGNIDRGMLPFSAIDTSLYYTDKDSCKEEQKIYNKNHPDNQIYIYPPKDGNPNNFDCRGQWKLDLYDNNFKFMKDNPGHSGTSPFIIMGHGELTRDRGEEGGQSMTDILNITPKAYYAENCEMIDNLVKGLDENSPVGSYYKQFHKLYCKSGNEPDMEKIKSNSIVFEDDTDEDDTDEEESVEIEAEITN